MESILAYSVGERESPGGVGSESVRRQVNRGRSNLAILAVIQNSESKLKTLNRSMALWSFQDCGDDNCRKKFDVSTARLGFAGRRKRSFRLGNGLAIVRAELLGSRPVQQVQVVLGNDVLKPFT